jgi:hypothetical protein
MWMFLIAITFAVVLVLVLLIFYVGPELSVVVCGPTGSTGPCGEVEAEVDAQFFDGLASVATVTISFVQIGDMVTVTLPGFSFADGASPRTGQIIATGVVPVDMRPNDTVNQMLSTFSNVRKIGIMSVTSSGDIAIYVNAQVNDLINDDSWIASTNSTGNVSTSYTLL